MTTPKTKTKAPKTGTPTATPPAAAVEVFIRRLLADEELMARARDLVQFKVSDVYLDEEGMTEFGMAVLLNEALVALHEKAGVPVRRYFLRTSDVVTHKAGGDK